MGIGESGGPYTLSIMETAAVLSMGRKAVMRMINEKQLVVIKSGAKQRVTVASVEAIIGKPL